MLSYHSAQAGCIAGHCSVAVEGGSKRVDEVVAGDVLANGARVVCVVKTVCSNATPMVLLKNDLLLTPYHPVFDNGTWDFPINLGKSDLYHVDAVYNFVLDSQHEMEISGYKCLTLAHGRTDSDVVSHPYFSFSILQDLKNSDGFSEGLVVIDGVFRSVESDLICGISVV
ncbi:hypothetical protein GEMRC1_012122 [Eukaryota sp. GEM-RC1]